MGVTHIVQSTASSASGPRKNRRRTTKKAPRLADLQHNDVDEQMDDLDPKDKPDVPEASGSGDKSTPDDDDEIVIDEDASSIPQPSTLPAFAPLPANADKTTLKSEIRRIPIPPHRMTPIKVDWFNIFGPLTEILGLQVRMNVQRRSVEIRVRAWIYELIYLA